MKRKPPKFENWGRGRKGRRLIYFFAHLGLTFSAAILVILVGVGIFFLSAYIRGLIESSITNSLVNNLSAVNSETGNVPAPAATSAPVVVPQAPASPSVPEENLPPNLIYSTFYFGFSGTPWLNDSATTMFRDNNEAAIVFPPKYDWGELSSLGEHNSQTFSSSDSVPGISTNIIQDGGEYKVTLTAPDGSPIWTASTTPLISQYAGEIGVGGTPDDFLLVYGAFKGGAYEIKKNAAGAWSWTDVSIYFPYRVMHGGFNPAIISGSFASGGSEASPHSPFYVYSLTPNDPKLVKLFSDASGNIAGAVDFTPLLFPSGVQSAVFAGNRTSSGSPTSQILFAKVVDVAGAVRYYQFTDNGFDVSAGSYTVQSTNINNYPWPVYGVKLVPDFGSVNGVPAQFLVSNDGVNWQPAAVGEETVFQNTAGTELLWKAVFTPSSGSAVSPFISDIKLSFQVMRPQ